MAIKDLIDYMKQYSAQGYEIDDLEKHLIEQGYNKAQVAQAAHTVRTELKKKPTNQSLHPIFIGVAALFFLSVAALLFFLLDVETPTGPQQTVTRFDDSLVEIEQTLSDNTTNETIITTPIVTRNQTLTNCGESSYLNTTIPLVVRENDTTIECFGQAIIDCAHATILLLPDTELTTQNCLVQNQDVTILSSSPKDAFIETLSQIKTTNTNSLEETFVADPEPILTKNALQFGETITGKTFFYFRNFLAEPDVDSYDCKITTNTNVGMCEFWYGSIQENLIIIDYYFKIEKFISIDEADEALQEDELTYTFDKEIQIGNAARLYNNTGFGKEFLNVRKDTYLISTSYEFENAESSLLLTNELLKLFE
jgi:hypothetical protein